MSKNDKKGDQKHCNSPGEEIVEHVGRGSLY